MILKVIKYTALLLFNPIWYLQLLIPRSKKIWVFGAWFGERYSDNAKVLFEYVLEKRPDIQVIWLTNNSTVYNSLVNDNKPVAKIWSLKGIWMSLRAGYVFFSSGKKDVNAFFIHGAKLVLTWHGAPMKKIGLDDRYAFNKQKFWALKTFLPFLWEYKLYAVVSTAVIFNKKLASAFNLPLNRVLMSGYPRNDAFFQLDAHPMTTQLNKDFNSPRKIIYLPTFRDRNNNFRSFEDYQFDIQQWNRYLEDTNTVLITKGHYVDSTVESNMENPRLIQLSDEQVPDLNPFLKDMDVLITDYSGAYFDYLLSGKELILAPFDYKEYTTGSRELYFDYFQEIDGVKAVNWEEILQHLTSGTDLSIQLETVQKFNGFQDGNSCERLTQMIQTL